MCRVRIHQPDQRARHGVVAFALEGDNAGPYVIRRQDPAVAEIDNGRAPKVLAHVVPARVGFGCGGVSSPIPRIKDQRWGPCGEPEHEEHEERKEEP